MTQKLAPAEKIAQIYLPLFASLIIPDTKYTEPNAKNMKVPFYTYVWVTTDRLAKIALWLEFKG